MKEPGEMTVEELIDRYERDIVYDCHGLVIKIGRSKAGRELIRRGLTALPEIVAQLERTDSRETLRAYPTAPNDLNYAWAYLLADLADEHKLPVTKLKYANTPAWIAWAKTQMPVTA